MTEKAISLDIVGIKLESMANRIKELENQVEELRKVIESFRFKVRTVEIRDLMIEETKEMIYEYYKNSEISEIYPDDIADELGLDLRNTMRAVEELLEEDKIEEVG